MVRFGDHVLIVTDDGKEFLVKVEERSFGTHKGNIDLTTLVGLPYGSKVSFKKGGFFFVVRPTLYDVMRRVKRKTQIMYPKDVGYVILRLGICSGSRVIECGSGSGALTIALAFSVKPFGIVFSYERNLEFMENARSNVFKFGLDDWVVFKNKDVEIEGFDEKEVDAVFIDVREPERIVDKVWSALRGGGICGFLLPTTNQVSVLIDSLEKNRFVVDEVCEILLRRYKINPDRLRPDDMMIAHTGFLVFARKVLI